MARRRVRAGFSLLEVVLSTAVLAIGLGTAVYALLAGMALDTLGRERSVAGQAAQSALEELQAEAFGEVFARYNATTADDPAAGQSPGAGFAVPGLTAVVGDLDGLPGEIVFPGDGVQLLEDGVDAELGLPRDLDGDGIVDNLDHAASYTVLPVLVRVRWRGPNGDQEVVLGTTLNNERKTP